MNIEPARLDPLYVPASPKTISVLPRELWLKFTATLATRFGMRATDVRKLVPKKLEVTEYGRVRQLDGGDTMQARELVPLGVDGRDMSYVRYQLSVDIFAHIKRRKPVFEPRNFFGQLLRIVVIEVPEAFQGMSDEEDEDKEDGEVEEGSAEMNMIQDAMNLGEEEVEVDAVSAISEQDDSLPQDAADGIPDTEGQSVIDI
ncbi:hypothetical protein M378DRAFT_182111 [Amanita muscaria Koide BX008]|uniref:Uncharacterized protein n=1 Tax=Amanita muscaria (strain Koide BX008) TaxID=946122 RepID=A0A0C2WID7_AMAMK|nr:hypothetical protein M378DRAFT_182111 [Amanita muscaria Koide BX008]